MHPVLGMKKPRSENKGKANPCPTDTRDRRDKAAHHRHKGPKQAQGCTGEGEGREQDNRLISILRQKFHNNQGTTFKNSPKKVILEIT